MSKQEQSGAKIVEKNMMLHFPVYCQQYFLSYLLYLSFVMLNYLRCYSRFGDASAADLVERNAPFDMEIQHPQPNINPPINTTVGIFSTHVYKLGQ